MWPKYQKPKDENMGWTKHKSLCFEFVKYDYVTGSLYVRIVFKQIFCACSFVIVTMYKVFFPYTIRKTLIIGQCAWNK